MPRLPSACCICYVSCMPSGRRFTFCGLLAAVTLFTSCISIPIEPEAPPHDGSLRVASYNIRYAEPDALDEHAAEVAGVITRLDADLLGLQEVMTIDYPDVVVPCPFRSRIAELVPGYAWVGPEGAAALSQSNAILYREDRYLPVAQGMKWYSPDPDRPDSTGYGNTLPRYLIWARFYDAHTDSYLVMINTHLDHLSRRTNREAIAMLVAMLSEQFADEPLILTGDFNEPAAGRSRDPIAELLAPVLRPADGPTRYGVPTLQIDAIYASAHFTVEEAGVVRGTTDEERDAIAGTSDHRPVVAQLVPAGL